MNLKQLNRTELDQRIKSLACRERELLHEVLLVIKEIDGRRLYLDMGFGNLFSYMVEGVGYSEGAAQRRIDAARLLKEIPSLGEKIESNSVNLSQISIMQKFLREAKKNSQYVSTEDKLDLLEQVSGKTYQETQKEIAVFLNLPVHKAEIKATQSDESVRVTLTLSKELYDKIQKAQGLLSHSLPSKELGAYLEFVTDKVIKQKTVIRTKRLSSQMSRAKIQAMAVAKPMNGNEQVNRAAQGLLASSLISKQTKTTADGAVKTLSSQSKKAFIPAQTKKVLLKSQGHCQYKDPLTGRVCQNTWHLQADHKHSRWAGGESNSENLQTFCRAHNIYKYKAEMKIKYVST